MTKEEYLESIILSHHKSIMAFAKDINVPYTTIKGVLSRGISGASVQIVIKICDALGLKVEYLMDEQYNQPESDNSTPPTPMEIGEVISYRRKQSKMTIDELSIKSDVPKGTLDKIINGVTKDPQLSSLKAIARALGCTLEELEDIKKSPAPAEAEVEDEAFRRIFAERLAEALTFLGLIKEGEDLTDGQMLVLQAVFQIISVTFGKSEDEIKDTILSLGEKNAG